MVIRESSFSVKESMLFLLASAEKNRKTLECEPKTEESKGKHTEFDILVFNFESCVR